MFHVNIYNEESKHTIAFLYVRSYKIQTNGSCLLYPTQYSLESYKPVVTIKTIHFNSFHARERQHVKHASHFPFDVICLLVEFTDARTKNVISLSVFYLNDPGEHVCNLHINPSVPKGKGLLHQANLDV